LRINASATPARQAFVPTNPAALVKGPTHVVKRGKTPVLSVEDARALLNSIPTDSLQGLRDRALIRVMLFSFARVSAVPGMRVGDFYENGRRRWFRLLEKGGKHHEVPVHHKAQDYMAEYLEKAGFQPNAPLFQTFRKKKPTRRAMSRSQAYRMIRRRALDAGVFAPVCCHSFRARWLDTGLDNLALSARWSGLPNSPLVTGGGYFDDPLTWERFRKAVEIRLVWLGQVLTQPGDVRDQKEQRMASTVSKVFVVHGHHGELRESCARFLEKQGLESIILQEQPNRGQTIIEKFESQANVAFAVVLMTKDDEGRRLVILILG
jgi:hypothetical protein